MSSFITTGDESMSDSDTQQSTKSSWDLQVEYSVLAVEMAAFTILVVAGMRPISHVRVRSVYLLLLTVAQQCNICVFDHDGE